MKRLRSFDFLRFCLLMVFVIFIQSVYAADPPLPTPVGRVVWIKGTLKAVMESKEERLLQKSSVIFLKDTLITDNASQAQIVFTDQSSITFRSSTKFFVNDYQFHKKSKGSVGKYIMNLIEGGFRTITGAVAKSNPSDYQINTPVATIGVRGTDYQADLNKAGLDVGCYTGRPCVKNQKQEVCLDEIHRYANVKDISSPPVMLKNQPDSLKQKLKIVAAKTDGFTGGGGTSGNGKAAGGTVNSFCIQ